MMAERKETSEIFTDVQYNRSCYQNNLLKLQKLYDKMNPNSLFEELMANLRAVYIQKQPHFERVLKFVAEFAISIQLQYDNEEEYEPCELLERIFEFLLKSHNAKEVAMRYRVCYCMNMILDTMADNAVLDSDVCDKILHCMMGRIMDESPKVRVQAALVLSRLQEPQKPACPVINTYILRSAMDPSAEVRRVILSQMAKNKLSLHAAMERTKDVDDSVRKAAYVFISKIPVNYLTTSDRKLLINNGLNDTSDAVKNCVREILIPAWIQYYKNSYNNFIKAIDPEHALDTVISVLKSSFKNADIGNLIEQLPIDSMKCVPVEQLTSHIVVYWRCLAEYFKEENLLDDFEKIMPEITPFCSYINEFLLSKQTRLSEQSCDQLSQDFILQQLFEIVKLNASANEISRRNLKNLILETLQRHHCSQKLTECLVNYFEKVVPETQDIIPVLVNVINEMGRPFQTNECLVSEDVKLERKKLKMKLGVQLLELEDEAYSAIQRKDYAKAHPVNEKVAKLREEIESLSIKLEEVTANQNVLDERNDSDTILRRLQIMYYMIQSKSISILSPNLRALLVKIVLPNSNLENDHQKVLSMALRCIGLCCLVDGELAKKCYMLCFLHISHTAYEEVCIVAVEIIFDLLLKYGFEHFDMDKDENFNVSDKQKNGRRNNSIYLSHQSDGVIDASDEKANPANASNKILDTLTKLLDCQQPNLQSAAIQGWCELILHKDLHNINLISYLWHDPSMEAKESLSQALCNFFYLYVSKLNESQHILEKAYLPTLRALANISETTNAMKADILRVSEVIIKLTSCTIHGHYNAHNRILYKILNEILRPDTELELEILMKSLNMIDVKLDGDDLKSDILKALDDVDNLLNCKTKMMHFVRHFRRLRRKFIDKTGGAKLDY